MSMTIARWTLADYHTLIQTGLLNDRPIELLNGLIVEMPLEGPDHADLSTMIGEYFTHRSQGRYQVRSAKPLTFPTVASEPEPDLALVRPQSYRQTYPTATDVFLVIEFARTSLAKDTDEKRRLYATVGIADYWVVNLREVELIVYRQPCDGDYQLIQHLTTGKISPLAFPDVEIDLAQVFAR